MSGPWIVIALSLSAAFVFAASTALKHASASSAPDAQSLEPGSVGAFVRATVAHRLWLCAIGLDVIALALQVIALHLGALSMVQPLLVSGLLFALILRKLFWRESVSHAQIGWAILLTGALGGFLLLAAAGPPSTSDSGADRLPAVIAGAVGLALGALCVEIGRRQRGRARAAATLGAAVGMLYAATAALIKALTTIAASSPLSLLTSWQLYAVITVGAVGLLLNQIAFQAGPLSASLPATGTVDPLLSIAIGVAVFDEHINRGIGAGTGLLALLVVMGVAVIALARVPAPPGPSPREVVHLDRPLEVGALSD